MIRKTILAMAFITGMLWAIDASGQTAALDRRALIEQILFKIIDDSDCGFGGIHTKKLPDGSEYTVAMAHCTGYTQALILLPAHVQPSNKDMKDTGSEIQIDTDRYKLWTVERKETKIPHGRGAQNSNFRS
jgi:hypothetical protein